MALIESMPVVPYIDAPDERTTLYIAPQVRDVLGIDATEYVAAERDPWFDNLHPDDRDTTIRELEQLLAAGGGKQEYRFVRPDTGETVWIEDRLSVIYVDGRRISPGVLLDVTRQKLDADTIAENVAVLRRIDEVSQQFSELVVSSGDVTEIVRTLSDVLRTAVVLEDATGLVVAREGTSTQLDGEPMAYPVVLRGERWGTLRVHASGSPTPVDALAIDRATTAIGLALLVEREANLLTDSARTALVNDLVMERITSGRELRRRARALGVDLGRDPLCVVVLEPLTPAKTSAKGRIRQRNQAAKRLSNALDAAGARALVASEGERVVAVVAVPVRVDVREMASSLTQPTVRVGVSALADTDGLLRAYQQAVDAVHHAAQRLPSGGAGAAVAYGDLGLSVLLDRLAEGPELGRFFEAELGPLIEHDRAHGAHLVATLQALLAENLSKTAAARRLGVERRTVYYRVERITEILGRDLDSSETRLRLELALRAWESLEPR
jgi:purine catabolism regulator